MNASENRQLTIRLDVGTISDLEKLVGVLQKDAPPGIEFSRTDALRTAIMRGVSELKKDSARKSESDKKPARKR